MQQLSELDKLYHPSAWQKRYPQEQIIEEYWKFLDTESEKLKKHVKCEFNVPYGVLPREKYDILGIDLPDDSPIVIVIHGGYWEVKELTHSNHDFIAKNLHKHKVKVMTVGYELCPDITVKDILLEIEIALTRCLKYAKKIKSRGVYLLGHSVGAHMAAIMFSTFINSLSQEEKSLFKAVFLLCGIYDVTPLTQTIVNQQLKLTEEDAREISPQLLSLSSPDYVNFHVVVAEHDSPAFIDQGKAFYEKLRDSGLRATYHFLEGIDHFNAIENFAEEDYELVQIILKSIL